MHVYVWNGNFTTAAAAAERSAPRANFTCAATAASARVAVVILQRFTAACGGGDCVCVRGRGRVAKQTLHTHTTTITTFARV